jgi:hypothetical protein
MSTTGLRGWIRSTGLLRPERKGIGMGLDAKNKQNHKELIRIKNTPPNNNK